MWRNGIVNQWLIFVMHHGCQLDACLRHVELPIESLSHTLGISPSLPAVLKTKTQSKKRVGSGMRRDTAQRLILLTTPPAPTSLSGRVSARRRLTFASKWLGFAKFQQSDILVVLVYFGINILLKNFAGNENLCFAGKELNRTMLF